MTAIAWRGMSIEEYAAFERSQGVPVLAVHGFYWMRVRPFFYRPLLPFREYPAVSVDYPARALLGGYQVAVPPGEGSNSHMGMLLFREPLAYSLGGLAPSKRKQVRKAAAEFVVRPIDDVDEFKEDGYHVYLSFLDRTNYGYKSDRREKPNFDLWADSVFSAPKILVFGAYRDGKLQGASISRLVEDTVVSSTMFSEGQALIRNVNSLLLHALREAASETPEVRQIFISMASNSGRTSVEEFFLVRGCELVRMPALLRLNPLARLYLRLRMPRRYAALLGTLGDEGDSRPETLDPEARA